MLECESINGAQNGSTRAALRAGPVRASALLSASTQPKRWGGGGDTRFLCELTTKQLRFPEDKVVITVHPCEKTGLHLLPTGLCAFH